MRAAARRVVRATIWVVLLMLTALPAASIWPGRPVVRAQTPLAFKLGERVRVRTVSKPTVLVILGLFDDAVHADESGVYVNGAAVTGFSRDFLTRHRLARELVQYDHYFVMGEERVGDEVSDFLGFVPAGEIEKVDNGGGQSPSPAGP